MSLQRPRIARERQGVGPLATSLDWANIDTALGAQTSAEQDLLDITAVEHLANYSLRLSFENGEQRLFDMTPLLHKKPFATLQQVAVFLHAHVAAGTVAWPGNIDIAPETLYDQSSPLPAPSSSV
jgi:hypothetical protein